MIFRAPTPLFLLYTAILCILSLQRRQEETKKGGGFYPTISIK